MSRIEAGMAQWQTAEAKQNFSALIAAAEEKGPQVVMRHKEAVAVVLSAEDYRRLKRQADANFGRLLAQAPFEPDDIEEAVLTLGNGR